MPIRHPASWRRALRHAAIVAAVFAARPALADMPADGALASSALDLRASALDLRAPASEVAAAGPFGEAEAPIGRRRHILGLQLDVGVPDITAASLLYRPWSYVRFSGGMLYNLAGFGVRGGVSVLPYFPLAPSLNLEAGHYFDANFYTKINSITKLDENLKPVLSKVGYNFVNASLGLEIGHPDWFVFFIRAGLSKVWLQVKDANKSVKSLTSSSNGTVLTHMDDPSVKLGIPNVKLGFMLFFY
jgi:hypothetical protein